MTMWALAVSCLLCLGLAAADSAHDDLSDLLPGSYCRGRGHGRSQECCTNRDDDCGVPLLGTLCYCDVFCNRTHSADCCPDFWEHCMGITPPDPLVQPHCWHAGLRYNVGETVKRNCLTCTCRQTTMNHYEFHCDDKVCLVRPELVQEINNLDLGWKASNYSMFWGKTLDEGIRYRLGTYKSTKSTLEMSEIHQTRQDSLPESFDSRQRWPGMVEDPPDQGDCGSSWAVSTAAVASDRLAIQSGGLDRAHLSAQHLISCQNRRQRGCEGGHIDRAWWYLRKKGVATEECYPYESGATGQVGSCKARRFRHEEVNCPGTGRRERLHFSTPPYRIAPQENVIMQEIYSNGPVQATFKVNEDFFLYQYGIYRHIRMNDRLSPQHRQHGYHSVRIIGWGVDNKHGRPVKYWLCANSWGRQWGEGGFFRLERGTNECEIEEFVVAVWGRREEDRLRMQSNRVE